MNYDSKEYLPDSEERIKRLQKIVNGRPVAILAAGPSICELEDRICELRHADICYFGLNNFFVQEKHVLGQINKNMSVVMGICRDGIPEAIRDVVDFLNRDEDNMFISTFVNYDTFGLLDESFSLEQFIRQYDRKLLSVKVEPDRIIPNADYPLYFTVSNSLLPLIQMALIGKASSIVLFGTDGHCGENPERYYYRQNEYNPQNVPNIDLYLVQDTKLFFNPVAATAIRNTRRTYDLAPVNILNCSLGSFYTPFPKVSYDDALEYLLTGKKLIGKLDLRVPAKPKMPNKCLLAIEKVINFWKKHRWSSFKVITVRVWRKEIREK